MADEQPSLHIDTDWKKQAQEEKRRLAEQSAASKPTPPPAPAMSMAPASPSGSATATDPRAPAAAASATGRRARGQRELPPPGFPALVQSLMTQVLFYLGDLAAASGQGGVDLDMAKHQLDTLSMLEDKTQGNLSAEETRLLDAALYETRSRFLGVASQFLGP